MENSKKIHSPSICYQFLILFLFQTRATENRAAYLGLLQVCTYQTLLALCHHSILRDFIRQGTLKLAEVFILMMLWSIFSSILRSALCMKNPLEENCAVEKFLCVIK